MTECDFQDIPMPLPPGRAFDAELPQRVAAGNCGAWEAAQVRGLLAWLDIYERALKRIAVYGDGDSAMFSLRVLAGCVEALDGPWK